MSVVVFVDGPLKGQGREYPHLPKQVFQPVAPPRQPTWRPAERYHLLYEYEVDQEPFADTGTDEGTEPVYEAHQTMMWIVEPDMPDARFAKLFAPTRASLIAIERAAQEPFDAARLAEFMVKFKLLMEEYGVTFVNGDYAESSARFELGYADQEIDG